MQEQQGWAGLKVRAGVRVRVSIRVSQGQPEQTVLCCALGTLCCLGRFTRYKELGMLIPAQTCASYPTFGRITAPLVFRGP